MPSRLLYRYKKSIKTILLVKWSRKLKGKTEQWLTCLQLRQETSLPGLHCHFWKLHRHQCLVENILNPHSRILDGFHWCRFCCRHRAMKRCMALACLPQWSGFLHQPEAYYIIHISHSNDKKSLNCSFLKTRSSSYKHNCYKNPQTRSVC